MSGQATLTRHNTEADASLDHVLKYTGIFGGVQGLTMLMRIVRNKLASTFLGTAGIGLMGIYISVSEFVSSTTNFGIPFSSVRRSAELYEEGNQQAVRDFVCVVRTWCVWTALLAAITCVACAPLLGGIYFDGDTTSMGNIALLAPMAVALSITNGEISILKGTRRLKRVATISALGSVVTLCATVPFFWAWHVRGIIVALNVSAIAMTVLHLCFSCPIYPWRIAPFSASVFREGWQMVCIGVPYVAAAIAGSCAAMFILSMLKRYGSADDVGLYRVGYGLMVTYAGVVFSAFEADFFPRLSSLNHDVALRNKTINKQVCACILLMTPLLIVLVVGMPLIVPLLTTSAFLPVASMATCAAFYMFLRCITLPMAYTALACGDSLLYLFVEVVYDIVSMLCIVGCYLTWGITGTGIGLSLSALFDLILISTVYGHHYHLRIAPHTAALIVPQALLLGAAVCTMLMLTGWVHYLVGTLLAGLSLLLSWRVLARDTAFVSTLSAKWASLRNKLHT